MSKFKDLTGMKFERWTVESLFCGSSKKLKTRTSWNCVCDCGTRRVVKATDLLSGKSRSCGCLSADMVAERSRKHGLTKQRLHRIWCGIKTRCFNKNHHSYEHYGKRGISVCDEWLEFINFKEWSLNSGYNDELTLERIDNNGDYTPENCKWATIKEQANNKRSNVIIEYKNKKYTAEQLGEKLGISGATIRRHYHNGFDIETIVEKQRKK